MEKQITRFPHVAEKIFDFLDIRSLAKSREVCKLWKIFIESSKFFWVKFINEFLKPNKQSEEIRRQWKRVLFMANIRQIIGIAVQLQKSMCICLSDLRLSPRKLVPENYSPLPVLAILKDSVNIYKDLCKKISNDKINPLTNYFTTNHHETCLHTAVHFNNVELFRFIIENVKEKNPAVKVYNWEDSKQTPLHLAAKNGNLEICKIIIANVGDLSCLDEKFCGKTPFEVARERNHLDICFYFNEIRNQSSLDIGWIFQKNVGIYFLKESESTAVTTKAVTTTAVTTRPTETSSFWSKKSYLGADFGT